MIIDTHCHLYMQEFDADREETIARSRQAGVKYLISVGIDEQTNGACLRLAQAHPFIFHTAGLHPHSAHLFSEAGFERMRQFARETKPVAIGEVGLDYFKSQADTATQKNVFSRMIGLALDENLPLVVHSRQALEDTLDILKTEGKGKARGVIHCFSYDLEAARKFYALGFLTSFTCNVTYKNAAALADVAANAPLDRIMLETDSPYLSPQSCRGKRNEPSRLVELAGFLSARRGIGREELEKQTSQNAMNLFGLALHE